MNDAVQYLCQKELQRKLNSLNQNQFETKQKFQFACLELSRQAKRIYCHFVKFNFANFVACSQKSTKTQKEIARFVWDFNQMNFN